MRLFVAFSLAILAISVSLNPASGLGNTQSVAVKGILMCNGRPSVGTKVKLYDRDRKFPQFCIWKIYGLLYIL